MQVHLINQENITGNKENWVQRGVCAECLRQLSRAGCRMPLETLTVSMKFMSQKGQTGIITVTTPRASLVK